jgi:hypothetical protein
LLREANKAQKGYILTYKHGIPLSVVLLSAVSTNDIKSVTDVIDNLVIKRTFVSGMPKEEMRHRRKYHHHVLI